MAGQFFTEQEARERLGVSADELLQLIQQGRLTPQGQNEGGERLFPCAQVEAAAAGAFGDGADGADDVLFDLDDELDAQAGAPDEDAVLFDDIGAAAEPSGDPQEKDDGAAALDEFDFLLEDDAGDGGADDGGAGEGADFLLSDDDAGAPDADDELDGGDMITEVVDVGELDIGSDDLLSDVIEDSSDEVSAEELKSSRKDELSSTQAATVDITELGDETETFESEDVTSDITQLDDDLLGDDEGEDVVEVVGEGVDHDTDFDEEEDDALDYGAVLVRSEPPFPLWTVVLLALIMACQLLGVVFIAENALRPDQPSGLSSALNVARFFQ